MSRRTWARLSVLALCAVLVLATLPAQAVQAARSREGNACSGRSGQVQQGRLVATGRLPGTTTYSRSTPRSQRTTRNAQLVVPTYARVSYRGIYRGIDLVYHGTAGRLEYDWLLHPGARVGRIRLAISGVRHLRLAHDGALLLVTSAGTLRQARPLAYQTIKGRRHRVSIRYVLLGHGRVGLRLGRYDHHHALVIDPVLSYGSYLGGSGTDQATAVALDQRGDLFLTGYTTSADFITTTNAYSTSQASGNYDVFITEISPTGAVSYSTYLGGSSFDYGEGIAVDAQGNAYVTGQTNSSDFPSTVSSYSVQTGLTTTQTLGVSVPATGTDAFVAKLSADGSHLLYSTRLGSLGGISALGDTWGRAIAVAPEGPGSSSYDAYVTGQTDSPDFPVTVLSPLGLRAGTLPQTMHGTCTPSTTGLTGTVGTAGGPCYDAFVTRLGPSGAISYSTYLGGGQDDLGTGIAVSGTGIADVTGRTDSADFPISGTLQSFNEVAYSGTLSQLDQLPLLGSALAGLNGVALTGTVPSCNETSCPDAFVVQLDTTAGLTSTGTPQIWELNQGLLGQLTTDLTGTVASTPLTQVVTLPLTTTEGQVGLGAPGALLGPPSERWGTFLSGSNADEGRGIAVDPRGNVYVTGATSSSDFTTTTGAYTTTFSGATCPNGLPCPDAFVAKLPPDGSRLVYSSRFGGAGADSGNAIAVDTAGHAYVTGQTGSADFPTLGSLQPFVGVHAISSTASYTTSMAFVVRMNKQGSGRFYSSYLGGSGGDAGSAIAVDGIGDVMLAGNTGSTDFLTLKPQQPQNKGGQDAFVSGIDATTRHLTYGYDGLNRLNGVSETLGNTYAYSYDIAGNRTDAWLNGVDIQHAQFDPASELITLTTPQSGTTIQSYDAAGNLSTDANNSYNYDALDRLTTLTPLTSSQQTSYTYTGDGVLLVQATGSQTPTLYTQDLATSQGSLNMPPPPPPAAYPSMTLPPEPPTAPAQSSFAVAPQQPTGAPSGVAAPSGFASATGSFAAPQSAASFALNGTGGTTAGVSQVSGGMAGTSFASQGRVSVGTASVSAVGQPGTTGPSPLVATQNQALLSGGQYVPLQPQSAAAGTTLASGLSAAASPLQLALSSQTLATPESAGGLSQVLQTSQGNASTDYLYGLDRLASLNGSTRTWYVTDLQGSVRYTQSDSGGSAGSLNYDPQPLRYDPYGAVDRGADGDGMLPATFGYRGELQDPNTGLIDLRARMYNPATDQFLTRDPLVQQTDQPYSYATGDPINNADPSGQDTRFPGIGTPQYLQESAIAGPLPVFNPGIAPVDPVGNMVGIGDLERQDPAHHLVFWATVFRQTLPCDPRQAEDAALNPTKSYNANIIDTSRARYWDIESIQAYNSGQDAAPQDVVLAERQNGFWRMTPNCNILQFAQTEQYCTGGITEGHLLHLQPGTGYPTTFGFPSDKIIALSTDVAGLVTRMPGRVDEALVSWEQAPGLILYTVVQLHLAPLCPPSENAVACAANLLVFNDFKTLFSNANWLQKGLALGGILGDALFVFKGARALSLLGDVGTAADAADLAKAVNEAETGSALEGGNVRQLLDEAEVVAHCTPCFPAGTLVATPQGRVAIQTLHVGDTVLAENPKTGKVEAERLTVVVPEPAAALVEVDLSDGSKLRATPNHLFWVDGGQGLSGAGWLTAAQLRPGDRLRTASGKEVVVVRVRRNAGRAVVYTLTVAHDHTFFVGTARVLVHNASGPFGCNPARLQALETDPQTGRITPASQSEAISILQAEEEGLVRNARRPNTTTGGEPNIDFIVDGGYADVKTPINPSKRPLPVQAEDIAAKVKVYSKDVLVPKFRPN